MAVLLVSRRRRADRRLQLRHPAEQARALLTQRGGILGLGLQPPELPGGLGKIALQRQAVPVELVQVGRLVLQLVDALLVEVAVGDDLLHLPVEQAQHVLVLRAERPGAGGAVPLRPGFHQSLALVAQLLILIEQSLALGARVLRVPNPRRPGVLGLESRRRERQRAAHRSGAGRSRRSIRRAAARSAPRPTRGDCGPPRAARSTPAGGCAPRPGGPAPHAQREERAAPRAAGSPPPTWCRRPPPRRPAAPVARPAGPPRSPRGRRPVARPRGRGRHRAAPAGARREGGAWPGADRHPPGPWPRRSPPPSRPPLAPGPAPRPSSSSAGSPRLARSASRRARSADRFSLSRSCAARIRS